MNILAKVVTKDIRSTTARNLKLVETETAGLTWMDPPSKVREALAKGEPTVPETDGWRVPYLGKLLEQRDSLEYQGNEDSEDFRNKQDLIDSLCIN